MPRLKHANRRQVLKVADLAVNFSSLTFVVVVIFALVYLTSLEVFVSDSASRERLELMLAPLCLLVPFLILFCALRTKLFTGIRFFNWFPLISILLSFALLGVTSFPRPYYFEDIPRLAWPGAMILVALGFLLSVLISFLQLLDNPLRIQDSFPLRVFLSLLSLAAALISLLWSSKYWSWGLRVGDSLHALNDYAAAAKGQLALSDYFSQYQNLLSLPIFLFSETHDFSLTGLLTYILIAQVVCLALILLISILALGVRWAWVSLPLILTFVFLRTYSGHTVFDSWAVVPGRLLMPLLLGAIILMVNGLKHHLNRNRCLFLLVFFIVGFISGSTLLNNLDFGGPAILACALVAILGVAIGEIRRSALALMAISFCIPFLGYWLWGELANQPIALHRLGAFVLSFQSGSWWSIAMPPIGMHLLYLALPVWALAWSLYRISSGRRFSNIDISIVYFGTFSTLTYSYFAGRSHFGNLSPLNVSLAIVLVIWAIGMLKSQRWFVRRLQLHRITQTMLPVTLLLTLGLIALFGRPPESTNFGGTPSGYKYTRYVELQSIERWMSLVWNCGWADLLCRWVQINNGVWEKSYYEDKRREVITTIQEVSPTASAIALFWPVSALFALDWGITQAQVAVQPSFVLEDSYLLSTQCQAYSNNRIKFIVGQEPPSCVRTFQTGLLDGKGIFRLDG